MVSKLRDASGIEGSTKGHMGSKWAQRDPDRPASAPSTLYHYLLSGKQVIPVTTNLASQEISPESTESSLSTSVDDEKKSFPFHLRIYHSRSLSLRD